MPLPKTKSELLAAGTYRADRHADRVDDQFSKEPPTPPAELSRAEKKLFRQIVASYPVGTLTPSDSIILTLAVRWYLEWQALDAILRDDPSDYKTATLAAMASKQLLAALSKLGLNPVDRRRLAVPAAAEIDDDPFTEWLKAKRANAN